MRLTAIDGLQSSAEAVPGVNDNLKSEHAPSNVDAAPMCRRFMPRTIVFVDGFNLYHSCSGSTVTIFTFQAASKAIMANAETSIIPCICAAGTASVKLDAVTVLVLVS